MAEKTLLRAVIEATGLSRRRAFEAIREGRVAEDGVIALDPSRPYQGGVLSLDGSRLTTEPRRPAYLLLHKPPGVVTTSRDERGRPGVLDLVPAALRAPGLHAIGRLDQDSSGLLILTNDGDLTHRLSHPRYEVEKEYWVATERRLNAAQLGQLRRGVHIDGAVRRPASVRRLADGERYTLALVVREGRKRQVRRMVGAVGTRVTALKRVREGPLALGDLAEGGVRELTPTEVEALKFEGPPSDSEPGP